MKKKKGGGGGGANWMDTYGDMVTLLLCFFVLLYSMSTVDESKWKAIVQSFNPNALILQEADVGGYEGPLADPDFDELGSLIDPERAQELDEKMQEIAAALQELYESLQNYVEENGLTQSITVTQGDGYVFITFNDAVFFRGDSYELLPTGQEVLDVLADALNKAAPYIDEVRIMGHTAQAYPDRPNQIRNDRFLASNRATVATIYLQERTELSGARIVSEGYGQWRPVDLNTDEAHRSHNRRVEIKITGLDLLNQMGDSIQQYTTMRNGGAAETTEEAGAPEGSAETTGESTETSEG